MTWIQWIEQTYYQSETQAFKILIKTVTTLDIFHNKKSTKIAFVKSNYFLQLTNIRNNINWKFIGINIELITMILYLLVEHILHPPPVYLGQ